MAERGKCGRGRWETGGGRRREGGEVRVLVRCVGASDVWCVGDIIVAAQLVVVVLAVVVLM